jgi:excisionase family DNA binding protein
MMVLRMSATDTTYDPERQVNYWFGQAMQKLDAERAAARQLEAAAERGAAAAVEAKQRDPRDLLTVREAAARLNVTDRTVRNLIAAGRVPTVLIPGTTARRIEPDAVDALIATGREVRK